jgi:signal transduction histidine kinase
MEQEMIFEKFCRGCDQRMLMPGTGMGLPSAKAIVELHGGKSELSASLDADHSFIFRCPCPERCVALTSYCENDSTGVLRVLSKILQPFQGWGDTFVEFITFTFPV